MAGQRRNGTRVGLGLRCVGLLFAGSPFTIPVIDGRKAVASGECLGGVVIANKPCSFDVNTRMVNGEAPLFVGITCNYVARRY